MNYEVKDALPNYNFYENGQLKFIFYSRQNALLVKDIMECDEKNEHFATTEKIFFKEIVSQRKWFKLNKIFESVKVIISATILIVSGLFLLCLLVPALFETIVFIYKNSRDGFICYIAVACFSISVLCYLARERW